MLNGCMKYNEVRRSYIIIFHSRWIYTEVYLFFLNVLNDSICHKLFVKLLLLFFRSFIFIFNKLVFSFDLKIAKIRPTVSYDDT